MARILRGCPKRMISKCASDLTEKLHILYHFVTFTFLELRKQRDYVQVQTAGCVFADALGQPKFGIRQVFGCLPSSIRQ